ncbi:unnamed protein product [Brachionus calyciflorus]|uniref:Uncharacterized protein n=1 Tax=Brachionus calyciflorus TaxID=104777 RepID=A0A813PUG5_9BILA|nr:unnamed protein product [Brachionus calyciflorus]
MQKIIDKKQLEKKLQEQNVLKFELENLKPSRRVYEQLSNSNIFFKTDLKTALYESKKNIKILEAEINLQIEKEFDHPKYSYSKSSKFEDRLKNLLYKCEMRHECSNYVKESAQKQNCILNCVSKKCYEKIYEYDPLEDGEIDQRFKSFKGCVSKEI